MNSRLILTARSQCNAAFLLIQKQRMVAEIRRKFGLTVGADMATRQFTEILFYKKESVVLLFVRVPGASQIFESSAYARNLYSHKVIK